MSLKHFIGGIALGATLVTGFFNVDELRQLAREEVKDETCVSTYSHLKLRIPLFSNSGSGNANCSRIHQFQHATVFRRWSLTKRDKYHEDMPSYVKNSGYFCAFNGNATFMWWGQSLFHKNWQFISESCKAFSQLLF